MYGISYYGKSSIFVSNFCKESCIQYSFSHLHLDFLIFWYDIVLNTTTALFLIGHEIWDHFLSYFVLILRRHQVINLHIAFGWKNFLIFLMKGPMCFLTNSSSLGTEHSVILEFYLENFSKWISGVAWSGCIQDKLSYEAWLFYPHIIYFLGQIATLALSCHPFITHKSPTVNPKQHKQFANGRK